MRKATKLLTLVLAALMLMSIAVVPASAAFTDVSVEDEALYEAVELLTTLGITKGTTETTFGPDELVTRQQMAAFVYRLMKAGRSQEGGENQTNFTDLNDPTFFYMISWANQQGIIKGTSATTFNPTGNITLQDGYVMLVRALGYENEATLPYPFGYIDQAEEIGLDENLPSDLDYTANLTRGQVAIMIANAFYADMNEITTEYTWISKQYTEVTGYDENGDPIEVPKTSWAYMPEDVTQTIARKVFGVEEETFFVTATTHYGFNDEALYSETNDVDTIKGTRYDKEGAVLKEGFTFEMEDLGLEGTSDDYFLSELTLFVKKDSSDINKDKVIAAKSNLVKTTVKASDVTLERSTKTDAKYYVEGTKSSSGTKVMTGYVTFGGVKAYLDIDNAPYSYKALGDKTVGGERQDKGAVEFIDLTAVAADDANTTYRYDDTGIDFSGDYAQTDAETGAHNVLTNNFKAAFPTVYSKGLYEADVYDVNGDGYAEYVFVKDYEFLQLTDKNSGKKVEALVPQTGASAILTKEDITISGEYATEDYVVAYVNKSGETMNTIDYIEIKETVAPVTSMVSGYRAATKANVYTFKTGETVDLYNAAAKFVSYGYADVAVNSVFSVGKSYDVYLKDGVLLYKDSISSGDFDADADYAIVLEYDPDPATKYVNNGTNTTNKIENTIVYSATGVVDGEFSTYFYVNAVIDGAVKAVKLADYANTHYSIEGTNFVQNAEVDSQKITDKTVAESVMYYDFYNKFSTFTVDSEGGYTFEALDLVTDTLEFAGTEEETAVYVDFGDAAFTSKNYTGSIYTIESDKVPFTRFSVKDYTKIIIKTIDDDGDDVYTVYTTENLPKYDTTVFSNAMAVFVNNKSSNIENLGILYAEVEEFGSKGTQDYRIITNIESILGENDKAETVISVLNIKDATTAPSIELTSALENKGVATGNFIVLTEDGKADVAEVNTDKYEENVMFETTFDTSDSYDADSNFLTFDNISETVGETEQLLTFVITDETTILWYTDSDTFEMVEEDIFEVEENPYDDTLNGALKLYVVAEDNDSNDTDETIKIAKSIVVKKA